MFIDKGLLHRMKRFTLRKAFDRGDATRRLRWRASCRNRSVGCRAMHRARRIIDSKCNQNGIGTCAWHLVAIQFNRRAEPTSSLYCVRFCRNNRRQPRRSP
jgi:hypothetical protein